MLIEFLPYTLLQNDGRFIFFFTNMYITWADGSAFWESSFLYSLKSSKILGQNCLICPNGCYGHELCGFSMHYMVKFGVSCFLEKLQGH